jgi:hypothetical protein
LIKEKIFNLLRSYQLLVSFLSKKGYQMTQRDKALYLDITPVTLRNWRKNKPNLYKIIMLGFAFKEVISKSKATYEELEKLAKNIVSS